MEYTRASSKGQIVIPARIRKKLGVRDGSLFAVASERDMIILKKVDTKVTKEDMKTLRLVEEAWEDKESGRYRSRSVEAFFKELKEW